MSKPRDDRQKDLFQPPLDQIIDLGHPLVRLEQEIDWGFLDERFSSVCRAGPGQPPLPTRLVAGLLILKHMHDLSDEVLCARWLKNPYHQYFCGEQSFQHKLPFERSSLTHWRQRLGESQEAAEGRQAQLSALIQESLSVAHKTGAHSSRDLERVAADTSVQPKAVAFPTDARLMHKAIVMLARLARAHQVPLHAKALHGNPYDGHTLGPVVAEMERLTGVEARRIHVDKGYRGHNYPNKFRVWISGQVRRVTKTIRREMRRRAAVDPVIGHLKAEHRMDRNHLKGREGDRANAVLATAGYNFSLLISWFEALLRDLIALLLRATFTQQTT